MPHIVVRRGDFQRYDMLYKAFGDRVPVIWDRRRSERRQQHDAPDAGERRTVERRGSLGPSWRLLGFVVAER